MQSPSVHHMTALETDPAEFISLVAAAGGSAVSLFAHQPGGATNFPLVTVDNLATVQKNLVDNGVKYTPLGGQVTARLTHTENRDRVQVEVSDTGMGIPRSDLPHIFDPLFRSEGAERAAIGTGLGLTIVRTILAQHGAEIRVQSEPERGTTFSFDLPAAA